MAEEKDDVQEETAAPPQKKGNLKLIIIIAAVTIVLGAGGFVGYKLMSGGGDEEGADAHKIEEASAPSTIVPLTPFILNLTDQGRYLKVTIEFEIADETAMSLVENKTPQLRDTIITLVSSKSIKSISSPEGKFQLKDELLFRANQVMGMEKDILKNLYFTEFVMQ